MARRLLFLSSTLWPEPNASAAGVRTSALLKFFSKKLPNSVYYVGPPQTNAIAKLPEGINGYAMKPNRSESISSILLKISPNIVVFDRFYSEEAYSFHVKNKLPNALRVLDMQDFHALRLGRQNFVERSDGELMTIDKVTSYRSEVTQDKVLKRELSSIHRSDLVLVCSAAEVQILSDEYGISRDKLILAPLFYDTNKRHQYNLYSERKHASFVSIGGWQHPPNLDAAKWLRYHIWPIIKQSLPEASLSLYGAYPNHHSSKLHDPALNFHILGYVDNLEVLGSSIVSLAPLRYGAGLKGKIADSWSYGTPVVTTSIGFEGMHDSDNLDSWGGLVASDAESFASLSIKLSTDQHLWKNCQETGFLLLEKLFSHNENLKNVWESLMKGFNDLPTLREQNITGELLWCQNARSTEYFSRWIELKEKGS